MRRIVVVGGGISGLAAAYRLQQRAKERGEALLCTLIERDARLGGKLHTEQAEGCLIEFGPDSLLARKPWGIRLCEALGLGGELVPTGASGSFVRVSGRLLPLPQGVSALVPTDLRSFLRTPLFSPWGKLRMGLEYFLPAKREAGDESLAHFVKRRLGREAMERLAEPLLSGIYAGDARKMSVQATFPQYRAFEAEYGGLVRAALAQRRRKQEGAPPSAGRGSPFVALRRGFGSLVDALESELRSGGVELITGTGAAELGRGAEGGYEVTLEDDRRFAAEGVVLALPAYGAAELLEELAPAAARELRAFNYASVAGVVLGYAREEVPALQQGTGYVVPRVEGGPVTAVTWVSEKWPHAAPPQIALFRIHMGRYGDDAVVDWSDGELVAAAREELRRVTGIVAEPRLTRLYRWRRAMPQYEVGHLERLKRIDEAIGSLPGVALCGAAYRGIGVPDCIRQGFEAADRLLERL